MISLLDAQISHCYRILNIPQADLAGRIGSYGIFKNSIIMKVEPDNLTFPTLKLQTKDGSCSVMGHLAKRIMVKAGKQPPKNIYEIDEGKTVVIDHIDGGKKLQQRLTTLNLVPGRRIKLQRRLPFMQYVILIDGKNRVKLSEAVASTIIGTHSDEEKQLSFARKDQGFNVTRIIAGDKMAAYLSGIGITEGVQIMLLGIEPGKQVTFDETPSIAIHVMEGYRLMISQETAKCIFVA